MGGRAPPSQSCAGAAWNRYEHSSLGVTLSWEFDAKHFVRLHVCIGGLGHHLKCLIELELSETSAIAGAEGKLTRLNLLLPHDCHDGHALHLSVADELPQAFTRHVHLCAKIHFAGPIDDIFAEGLSLGHHGQEAELCGCEPVGEVASCALREDSKEALDGAEDGAVHHDGLLALSFAIHVLELEALGQVEIALYGGALPRAANGIPNLEVNLWAIEGTSTLIHRVGPALALQRVHERVRGLGPYVVGAYALLRARGEVDLVVGEAKAREDALGEVKDAQDLIRKLLGEAEDVRVVLREAAHAEEPVKSPRALVAVHGAQLRPPEGQLAVGSQAVFVHEDVERAVHGLDLVLLLLHVHLIEHAVLVEVKVARCLPQVHVGHVGRVEELVARLHMLVLPEVLNEAPHARALGVPEDETATRILLDGE
mmetsp:Transcript_14379/g.38822  ORF Transcript_14379/g.38822 Transcript_14379/m.38822 type:complete len:426 (+) Transcript_14379:336-1613(+)